MGTKIKKKQQPRVKFDDFLIARNGPEKEQKEKCMKALKTICESPDVVEAAIMPDGCPTGEYSMPVGSVVTTRNTIHPNWHSSDLCCSLFCTMYDSDDVTEKMLLDSAEKVTHFGVGKMDPSDLGSKKEETAEALGGCHHLFAYNSYLKTLKDLAICDFGTQGDGNHFLFVGRNQNGKLTMVTHHGSRRVGASVFKQGQTDAFNYTNRNFPNVELENSFLIANSDQGLEYWNAIQLVREWTQRSHRYIHDQAIAKLDPDGTRMELTDIFWNEHNFVFKKGYNYSHAKGATPLCPYLYSDKTDHLNEVGIGKSQKDRRIIPMNMKDGILIVEHAVRGTGTPTRDWAPHGAGRNMSRTQHIKVTLGMRDVIADPTEEEVLARETEGLDVRFYSGRPDISELPSAYKSAEQIETDMRKFDLGNVVDRIKPYGTIMAGKQPWQR